MNILIVRVSSLGDVIHNMPMVSDILRHYPHAHIDWVVEEAYTPLVRLNPAVRTIIPVAIRRWRKQLRNSATLSEIASFYRLLRTREYDLVLETQGLIKTGVLMQMSRLALGGRRIGLANATEGSGYEPLSRIFHTTSVPVGLRTHAVMRGRLVAAAALNYVVDTPPDFNFQPPDLAIPAWMPGHPYAVFFHATARPAKQWAADRWIRIARALHERGLPVLLPWGSNTERHAAEQFAEKMPNARVLPKLSMQEAIVLAHNAALVIGVDTGLTHMAAAYGIPTVELYCDSPRWKTQGDWSPNIINLGDAGMPPEVVDVELAIVKLLGPDQNSCRKRLERTG